MDDVFNLSSDEDLPVEKKVVKKALPIKPVYTHCESRKCVIIKEDKLSALCINSDSLHIFSTKFKNLI